MRLPRQPAAVVFDMDGLLFDTEANYERAALSAAAELGRDMDSAFFRSTIGVPWLATRERLVELYGPSFAVDELRAVAGRIFNELVEADLPLKPGVAELLAAVAPHAVASEEDAIATHKKQIFRALQLGRDTPVTFLERS